MNIRQHIDLVESAGRATMSESDNGDYLPIEQSRTEGSYEGYVTAATADNIANWFEYRHHIFDDALVEGLRNRFQHIAVLNNIHVDEDVRGEGIGNELMSEFIEAAWDNRADAILLQADTFEDQHPGFDLVKWYQGWGFEQIHDTPSGPIMLLVRDE